MVREACGELRKAAAEVLEMIHESVNAEATEVAQYWQVRMVTADSGHLKKRTIFMIYGIYGLSRHISQTWMLIGF